MDSQRVREQEGEDGVCILRVEIQNNMTFIYFFMAVTGEICFE
jgi:hypothetical protein